MSYLKLSASVKPKVALLRGPLLNDYEMQSYEPLQKQFELVTFLPHQTYFDVSKIDIPKETLWCPIASQIPFERSLRKWQAVKDRVTGNTHSFCGMADRLKGFDIYHVMDQYFCFSYEAALAKRKHGGKLVVTQYENIPRLNEKKFMERHIKKSVRAEADLFLAMSDGARQTLMVEGVDPSKIKNVYGAVDTDHFSPGPVDKKILQSLGIPSSAFVILYVGRLAESKGVFTLLEAARRLVQEDSKVHFLLVGKDEEGISEWIAQNHMGGSVHLAGFVPYAQMPKYYRLSQLFVLPSIPTKGWKEQFGYVLAEAMACGVPVAGSDCGAIPEVVGNLDRIFPAGSAEKIYLMIKKIKKQRLGHLKAQSRNRALNLFSAEKLTRSLASIYAELLQAP
jgi:alpha-maltose-1-phosphate synthase